MYAWLVGGWMCSMYIDPDVYLCELVVLKRVCRYVYVDNEK